MRKLLLIYLHVLGLALAGCSGPARASAAAAGPGEALTARKLYTAKCAKCHKLYDPAKYSDAEWEKWMTKMGRKAKLKPDQQESLARYIEETYRTPAAKTPSTTR